MDSRDVLRKHIQWMELKYSIRREKGKLNSIEDCKNSIEELIEKICFSKSEKLYEQIQSLNEEIKILKSRSEIYKNKSRNFGKLKIELESVKTDLILEKSQCKSLKKKVDDILEINKRYEVIIEKLENKLKRGGRK